MPLKSFFRQEVLNLPAYHLESHKGIKLNQNESPWDIPVEIKAEVVEQLLKISWNRYPLEDPLPLQKKMAKYLGVWPDNLLFSNGSNVLIQALVMATSINSSVVVLDPTFSVYEIEAKLLGNKVHRVPLKPNDFSLPVEELVKTIKKTKASLVFIANPNAPTGNLFSRDDLLSVVSHSDCLVVIDEAYYPFSGETLIDAVKDHENLVLLRTFSKAFALGGLRLGWMVADSEVCLQVQKCLLPFCVGRLNYATALAVLNSPDYMTRNVDIICAEREKVFKFLSTLPRVKAYPSKTNFILFEVDNSDLIFKKLLHEKIIVRQVNDGRHLTQALRVSIGTPEENNSFIHAMQKVMA